MRTTYAHLWPAVYFLTLYVRVILSQSHNYTIDDEHGDVVTGQRPVYSPKNWWSQGNECNNCDTDSSRTFENTFHICYQSPTERESCSLSVKFTGTAVYVFNVLPWGSDLATDLTFELDGEQVDAFLRNPVIDNAYQVPVFSKDGLSNQQHTLKVSTQVIPDYYSMFWFDYILYTIPELPSEGVDQIPNSQSSTLPTSSLSSTTSPATSSASSSQTPSPTPTPSASTGSAFPPATSVSSSAGHQSVKPDSADASSSASPDAPTPSDGGSRPPFPPPFPPVNNTSPIDNTPPGDNHRQSPVAAVAGGIAGGIALVLAIVVLWLKRRRRNANHDECVEGEPAEADTKDAFLLGFPTRSRRASAATTAPPQHASMTYSVLDISMDTLVPNRRVDGHVSTSVLAASDIQCPTEVNTLPATYAPSESEPKDGQEEKSSLGYGQDAAQAVEPPPQGAQVQGQRESRVRTSTLEEAGLRAQLAALQNQVLRLQDLVEAPPLYRPDEAGAERADAGRHEG